MNYFSFRCCPTKKHKKGTCNDCNGCKICQCECDGIPVGVKMNRTRGGDTAELSGCSFIATKFNGRASRKKSKRITQESSPGELMEVLAISNTFHDDGMFVCHICKRNFSSAKRKDSHVCKGSLYSRDMASMAIKYAHELVTTGQVDYLETQYEFVSEATTLLDLSKGDLRECF